MLRRQAITRSERELVGRILSSRQFAHAHTLKRVLLYLVECADRGGPPPKEYEIAVRALGRPETFDPRTDPIVRVSVASIRNRLAAYFATEGRREPLRLEIPRGQYGVIFTPAEQEAETSEPERALSRFWAPYLTGRAPNVIIYTEPLFFRDNRGHFYRDWYINDPSGCQQVQELLKSCGLGPFEPAYHYLSAGEVHCMLSLSRMFHEMGVPVETRSSRVTSWNELRHVNLILLGSPRTNPFLSCLQSDEPFIVTCDAIENRRPQPGELPRYAGLRRMDGALARRTEYALVTRRPALLSGCAITMIASNHGKAIEGAGHFLTLDDRVNDLLPALRAAGETQIASRFQLLMRVEMMDLNDEVVETDCVAVRVLKETAATVS